MVVILNEIREMITMQGGDPSKVKDIMEGIVYLKSLMKDRSSNIPASFRTMSEPDEETETPTRRSRKKNTFTTE